MREEHSKLYKIVLTGLMAALCYVCFAFLKVPIPTIGGGDALKCGGGHRCGGGRLHGAAADSPQNRPLFSYIPEKGFNLGKICSII